MKSEVKIDRAAPQKASLLRVILGTLLVIAGLTSALVTVLARSNGDNSLAGAAAILSLVIALLLTIFIVPPLARSARVEVANIDSIVGSHLVPVTWLRRRLTNFSIRFCGERESGDGAIQNMHDEITSSDVAHD